MDTQQKPFEVLRAIGARRPVTPRDCAAALRVGLNTKHPVTHAQLSSAWQVWEWMLKSQDAKPVTTTIVSLLQVAANSRQPQHKHGADVDGAWRVWEWVLQHEAPRHPVPRSIIGGVITVCARARVPSQGGGAHLERAQKVWDWAITSALPPNVSICSRMLAACAASTLPQHGGGADVDGAWRVWEWMHANNVTPNGVVCDTLLVACSRSHATSEAARARHRRYAWRVWDWMQQAASDVAPISGQTCGSLMLSCVRLGGGSRRGGGGGRGDAAAGAAAAWRVWELMAERGVAPTVLVYEAMAEACAKSSVDGPSALCGGADVVNAVMLWRHMCAAGVTPRLRTYEAFLGVFAKGRLHKDGGGASLPAAWTVWRHLRRSALHPSTITATAMLNVCARGRSVRHNRGADVGCAGAVWRLMRAQRVVADAHACEAMLRACAAGRATKHNGGADVLTAWHIWQQVLANQTGRHQQQQQQQQWLVRARPNSFICAAVIDACANSRLPEHNYGCDLERAWKVWTWVVEHGPHIANARLCNSIVTACARVIKVRDADAPRGADVARARQVWEWMLANKVTVTTQVATSLITACARGLQSDDSSGGEANWALAWHVWEDRVAPQARLEVPGATNLAGAMLNLCAKSRLAAHHGGSDVPGAWKVWLHVVDSNVAPTAVMGRSLLRAFAFGRLPQHGGGPHDAGARLARQWLLGHGVSLDDDRLLQEAYAAAVQGDATEGDGDGEDSSSWATLLQSIRSEARRV